MSWEEFKEELSAMFDELEQKAEKHDLAESIRRRQPWVLWNDREDEPAESSSFLQRLVDLFHASRK